MVLVNGKLMEKGEINLDNGFWFGYGAFETLMVTQTPIFLTQHLNRLYSALERLDIQTRINEADVIDAVDKLNAYHQVLKIAISEENIVFSTRPNHYQEKDYLSGAKLTIHDVIKGSTTTTSTLKTMNYIDNLLSLKKAKSNGYSDGLFLNEKGFITECAVSNIFLIKNEQVYTPSVSSGLLNGILRQWVLTQTPVIETEITLDFVTQCDAAFLTNSVMGIMKVSYIQEQPMKNHTIITTLSNAYKKITST